MGERYYRAILNYRYLALTIGLMTAASCLNLLLTGIWKYAALVLVLALACALFHASFVPSGPPPDRCFPRCAAISGRRSVMDGKKRILMIADADSFWTRAADGAPAPARRL